MKSNLLKKSYKKVGAVALAAVMLAGFTAGSGAPLLARALDPVEYKTLNYLVADPGQVKMTGQNTYTVPTDAEIAEAIAMCTVVYTGYTHSMYSAVRSYTLDDVEHSETVIEYAVEILGTGEQRIAKKYAPGTGGHEIPVPGYLISIPVTEEDADAYEEGDMVRLNAKEQIWPDYTVDNLTKHVRVAVPYLNMNVRNKAGIVYYGPEFGTDTKQNQYGTELNAELNPENGHFEVKSFRTYGEGNDKEGIAIPEKGFALSAYVENSWSQPWCALLLENNAFSVGDWVQISGYDYLGLETDVTRFFDFLDPSDADDPVSAGFPENRGTNCMNIYTKSSDAGGNELNTNSWGFEAAVNKDNVVTALATNVINIPEGGFVVSGHGTAGDWIKSYVKVGASLTYDTATKTMRVATTQQSFLTTMQGKLQTYTDTARLNETRLYDLNFEALNEAVAGYKVIVDEATELDKKIAATEDEGQKFLDQIEFKVLMNQATNAEKAIIMQLTQSNVIEGRACWHRPNVLELEHNLDELKANLEILADSGINTVYVEMLWNGYASFDSEIVAYHPDLAKYTYGDYPDYFTAYIAEAKKVGIQVHAWVENFFVGSTYKDEEWFGKLLDGTIGENDDRAEQDRLIDSILVQHPEWAQYTCEGNILQPYEISGNYHFMYLDPARPEVRAYILSFYEELYNKFPDLAGLNLDYIRFPTSYGGDDKDVTPDIDSGYTEYAMNEFLEKYGYSVSHGESVDEFRTKFVEGCKKDEEMASDWHAYRVELITSFVKEVREMTNRVRPNAIISTSTVPDYDDAIETKMQDWRTWVKNGWIDLCTPMSYYLSAESVESNANQMILIIDNISYSYVGLGAYMGFETVTYVEQIDACYKAGATGYSLFGSNDIIQNPDVQAVLKATVNSTKSVIPSASAQVVLKAAFDDILDKADRIYIPKNAMTEAQKTALSQKFDEILAMPMEKAEELLAVYQALKTLSDSMRTYIGGWGVNRTQELLANAMKNVDIKVSRAYIAEKLWDPSTGAQRPDKPSTSSNNNNNNNNNTTEPKSNLGVIIGCSVAAGVVVIAGAVAAVFILRKKKKQ